MDFTREPVIETVITPREGCKLVVRSSKNAGQEEYFVDSLEVVSFGESQFYRSLERPKCFLLPISDYEILEVREARMVLKNVGLDRSIKIGGGRDAAMKPSREREPQPERQQPQEQEPSGKEEPSLEPAQSENKQESRFDKKRDRRRHSRRRRGREEKEEGAAKEPEAKLEESSLDLGQEAKVELREPSIGEMGGEMAPILPVMPSILTPPSQLISETISGYREKFKSAFYSREEKEALEHAGEAPAEDIVHESQPIEESEFSERRDFSEESADEDLWNFSEELSNEDNKQ